MDMPLSYVNALYQIADKREKERPKQHAAEELEDELMEADV